MKRRVILAALLLAGLLASCELLPDNSGGNTPTPPSQLPAFVSPTAQSSPPEPAATNTAVDPTGTEPAPPAEELTPTSPDATARVEEPAAEPTSTPVIPTAETALSAHVDRFPDPGAYIWVETARGLNRPVGLESANDGTGRLFALEQPGVIRIVSGSEVLQTPFLDIRDRVGANASEQGLLGLAFHPAYPQNGFFFVNYTDQSGDTVIARFRVSADPNQADPTTEVRLLYIPQPYGNHNGGVVAFGPDGYLYLGLGDGGSGGDPQNRAQSLDTLLGKVLRIDVNAGLEAAAEPFYAIPPDNPFANGGGEPEIWAYGLRNPWRFSFDSLTGDLYIADVGQNSYEEVSIQPAGETGGANYGWNVLEGYECFRDASCDPRGTVLPVHVYPNRVEGNCSITGGYVYRGSLPEWQGIYFFGDYCSGKVWGLLPAAEGAYEHQLLYETGASITTFGTDQNGELYLVNHQGSILRLEAR